MFHERKDILPSSFHYLRLTRQLVRLFPFLRKALFHFASILWHEGANSHLHNHLRVNIRVSNHLQRYLRLVHPKKIDLAKLLEVDLAGVVLVVEENCLVHNLKKGRQVKLLRDKARPSFFAVVAFFSFFIQKICMYKWYDESITCCSWVSFKLFPTIIFNT